MNWIATMNTGQVIKESEDFRFNSLDLKNVSKFRITESGDSIAVPFSCDSGIIRFTNLDLLKLRKLSGNEEITFKFNKDSGLFKLDKNSLELYQSIVNDTESSYYFIEFDQSGVFNINGESLFAGFEINEHLIEFKDNAPYNDIIQYANGFSEIQMRGNTPVTKNDKTINYVVGYKKQHLYNDLVFDLKYEIMYDLLNRYVMLNLIMTCNKSISGKIYISHDGKETRIPIKLTANNPMQTKRVLTVIG